MGNPPVFVREMSAEQAKIGSHNAFVGAGMYAATTFLALFMYMHRSKQERLKLGKVGAKSGEVGLGDDTFNAPLVESTGGATSATASDARTSERTASSAGSKKKKSKSKTSDAVTSI